MDTVHKKVAPFLMSKELIEVLFLQMSNKKQTDTDQEMSENSVKEILFSEETSNKKPKKDSKRLTTSSTQESGSGSLGEDRKIIPTPPDATGLVRITEKGKLRIDTKAIAQENKTLKASMGALQDEVIALRSQLEETSKSPRSHPDPSPAKDLLITEGLENVLCKSQFDALLDYVGERVQSAVTSGKEIISTVPSQDLEAPGPSKVASSNIGSAGKSSAKLSSKVILGSSLGDGSGDDLDDFILDDRADEDIIG